MIGNLGVLGVPDETPLSSRGREFVVAFWEFASFIANSPIFLLIGVTDEVIGLLDGMRL